MVFSSEKKDFDNISKIILPGQGAYNYAVTQLDKLDLRKKLLNMQRRECNTWNLSRYANIK